MNLLKNAKDALARSSESHIDIKAWKEGNNILVSIKDNGEGIVRENLDKVFSHGFTTKDSGHGFGLSYCSRIIKEIGGQISVHSDGPGMGATFLTKLPSTKVEENPGSG